MRRSPRRWEVGISVDTEEVTRMKMLSFSHCFRFLSSKFVDDLSLKFKERRQLRRLMSTCIRLVILPREKFMILRSMDKMNRLWFAIVFHWMNITFYELNLQFKADSEVGTVRVFKQFRLTNKLFVINVDFNWSVVIKFKLFRPLDVSGWDRVDDRTLDV